LLSPTEYDRNRTPPVEPAAGLSWGLVPFSAFSSGSPVASGLPHPTPSVFRVLRPLDGLRLPEPSSLVSCRWRSWGFIPPGLFPLTEPPRPFGCGCLHGLGGEPPDLQGFTPREDPNTRRGGVSHRGGPLPSWVFRPLGSSSLTRPAVCAADPLGSFAADPTSGTLAGPSLVPRAALQGLDHVRTGLASFEAAAPSELLAPSLGAAS